MHILTLDTQTRIARAPFSLLILKEKREKVCIYQDIHQLIKIVSRM